jgi:hypothetical protein
VAERVSYTKCQTRLPADTYPLAVVVEESLELDAQTHLEALVLQHPLDGRIFTTRRQLGLEDYTEGSVAHDLALRVCEIFVVAGQAVLDLFANNFCYVVSIDAIAR